MVARGETNMTRATVELVRPYLLWPLLPTHRRLFAHVPKGATYGPSDLSSGLFSSMAGPEASTLAEKGSGNLSASAENRSYAREEWRAKIAHHFVVGEKGIEGTLSPTLFICQGLHAFP